MKRILIAATALLAFVACTKETSEISAPEDGALQTITVNVAPFGDQTRTAVTPTGGFTWSAGDQIGIYPVASTLGEGQTAQQITFRINEAGDAKSATFNGTGWGLVTNGSYKYFSYYPYSAAAKYNEVAVTFADGLNQVENESTAHLGVNDYLYAPQIQPEDAGAWSFTFKHLSALVEFEITVPEEAKDENFLYMKVSAPSELFTVSGKYNPSSATTSTAPIVTENTYTDRLILLFNGGEGFTPDATGKIHAYFLIAPAAVKDQELSIKLYTDDNLYIATKTPTSDIVSQDYKTYVCSAVAKPLTVAENLSANGTANCYIVPELGKYKFLANVKGNGYDPLDEVNHNAAASIFPGGCTAEVLWESVGTDTAPDVGTVINNETITVEGSYIVFDATGTPGNALISLRNTLSGQIVWSWHIWSTSADLEASAQTYPNDAGVMMDRNLGALSATPGDDLTMGLTYQWGRPFPQKGGCVLGSSKLVTTTHNNIWKSVATSASNGTLAYSAEHPTDFIYHTSLNTKSDGVTPSNNWLWSEQFDTTPALWGPTKTMYDPCPLGWKLPEGGSDGFWKTAGFKDSTFPYSNENVGRIFISVGAYFPITGYRGTPSETGNGGYTSGYGNYYSCTIEPNTDKPVVLNFYKDSVGETQFHHSLGFSVRPVKENN